MGPASLLLLAILSLAASLPAGEIRLPKLDPVEVAATRYLFLGRDFDSAFVLITGSGRTWLYGFPWIGPTPPAGPFAFRTHEGHAYRVTRTEPQEARLDRSDTLVAPIELPPAYVVSQASSAPLLLQLRADRYRFDPRGMHVGSDGSKEVTLVRAYNGVVADTVAHPLGTPVRFHEVTLTLHALFHGGVGGHPTYILGYSPIHAASTRQRSPSANPAQPSDHGRQPLFRHPDRPQFLFTPSGQAAPQ